MKKLLLSIICSLTVALALGQGKVTFSPASFTAEDEVTITLDITGTPLVGQTAIYIWAFSNDGVGGGKNGVVNGEWGASSEAAKMTMVSANIFQFKFIGTALFGQSPAELINFGFLAKTKDGGKQSQDYKPFKFDPLVFTPSQFRVFPAKFDYTDMATVYFHQDLATDINLQRMYDVKVNLTFYDDAGNPVGSKSAIVAKKESGILYSYSFMPERVITIPAGTKLSKFTYQFIGSVKDANGQNVTTTGPVNEVVYTLFN
jgi:hypothetical protein